MSAYVSDRVYQTLGGLGLLFCCFNIALWNTVVSSIVHDNFSSACDVLETFDPLSRFLDICIKLLLEYLPFLIGLFVCQAVADKSPLARSPVVCFLVKGYAFLCDRGPVLLAW